MSTNGYYLVNYANEPYRGTQRLNSLTGRSIGGFDAVLQYGPDDVDPAFRARYAEIFSHPRGAGLWLWKPWIILDALDRVGDGDTVFYCDAGSYFVRNMRRALEEAGEEVFVTDIPLIERQWTKPLVFCELGCEGNPSVTNSCQIQSGFVGVRKCERGIWLMRRWIDLCCQKDLVWPLAEGGQGDCIAHREDQSLLSVLCKLEGVLSHRDPTQYGRMPEMYRGPGRQFELPAHPGDRYRTCIALHRASSGLSTPAIMACAKALIPVWISRAVMRARGSM